MLSGFTGDDFTSSFLAFLAGGGAVLLLCVGVTGRLGVAEGMVMDGSLLAPPASERLGEYRSSTW